jgi:hypothetical protein
MPMDPRLWASFGRPDRRGKCPGSPGCLLGRKQVETRPMRATSTIGQDPASVRGPRRIHRRRNGALLGVLIAGWMTAGCARASQLRECGHVISTVNDSLRDLENLWKLSDSATPKPPSKKLEAAYKQLARELGELDVRNSELKAQVGAYQALLNRAARGVSSLARARSSKDASDIDQATQSLAQIKSSALATNAQINRVCQSRY